MKTWIKFKYIIKKHWRFILSLVLGFVVTLLIFRNSESGIYKSWNGWINPTVSFITFLTALGIWIINAMREWERKLPKRLTVIFKIREGEGYRQVMRCERAYLSATGDIRTWGQQIGGQMVGNRSLQFEPYIEELEGEEIPDTQGNFFKPYTVTFYLIELPEAQQRFMKDDQQRQRINQKIKDHTIVWTPDPDNPRKHIESFEGSNLA